MRNAQDYMYVSTCKLGEEMPKGDIVPYGPIELEPSSTMLSYGQVLRPVALATAKRREPVRA